MSDSREQFEAWFLSQDGNDEHDLCLHPIIYCDYYYKDTSDKWSAWQASRACIEVELPEWALDDPEEIIARLKLLGVTVKVK